MPLRYNDWIVPSIEGFGNKGIFAQDGSFLTISNLHRSVPTYFVRRYASSSEWTSNVIVKLERNATLISSLEIGSSKVRIPGNAYSSTGTTCNVSFSILAIRLHEIAAGSTHRSVARHRPRAHAGEFKQDWPNGRRPLQPAVIPFKYLPFPHLQTNTATSAVTSDDINYSTSYISPPVFR